jgi:two-component system, cell cycle sensor histidine kinase and response regulator CckA
MYTDNTMKLSEPRHFQIRNEIILLLGVDSEGGGIIRRTLEAVGFPVLIADDNEQAADLFRSFDGAIRLLITDVTLPEEGALETIDALRRGNPTLKVIVASKEISPKELHTIHIAGVIELIRKPVDKEQLLQVVHRIVEK